MEMGFGPVFDKSSKVLILGSFPSVKSREIQFYYGHPQNRFWKMLCGYFNEPIPESVEERRAFLLRKNIALWDMIEGCDVIGSSDSSIRNERLVDLQPIFQTANIRLILLNGSLAYSLFQRAYAHLQIDYRKMPSTSPANVSYNQDIWWRQLDGIFKLD